MIKAIITDVDGVIVGKKQGVNFPLPNQVVIRRLQALQKKGIPVILCTSKSSHIIKELIRQADLRCPHITDAGALIIDPLDHKVIKVCVFDKPLASDIVAASLSEKFYTEVYGIDDYYLQKDYVGNFTEKRIQILQKEHITLNSLVEEIDSIDVIKIKIFAHNKEEKKKIQQFLEQFNEKANILWGQHPFTAPTEETNITVKGVSKQTAALEVLDYLKISPSESLGISDTVGDWNFMSLCKYVGVVGDESSEFKELAKTKGEGNYFFGSSVDDDGFLQIVDYFIK